GLYSPGYRFADMISFVVAAVQLAWPQFVFSNRRSPQAKELYSYAATYYLAGMLFLILGLSTLAPEILRVMAAPTFQRAATVVPIIALAYLCEGLCYIATIGIMLQRKPIIRSTAAIVAALTNLALNVLLIPTYGMLGAAWATLIAFMVQMILQVWVALRYYPIAYQWNRAARVLGLALAVYFVGLLVTPASLAVAVVAKALLPATFPVALWAVGFFEESELERVRQLGMGLRKRLVPSRASSSGSRPHGKSRLPRAPSDFP